MIHVYPMNDTREHDLESADCACSPRIIEVAERGVRNLVIVHNAWDAREVTEEFGGFEVEVEKWQETLCR